MILSKRKLDKLLEIGRRSKTAEDSERTKNASDPRRRRTPLSFVLSNVPAKPTGHLVCSGMLADMAPDGNLPTALRWPGTKGLQLERLHRAGADQGVWRAALAARVQYDNYSTDAELETKLLTGGGGYDVIFPSDRSMPPLTKKDQLAAIDKRLLPNLKHIDPKFLGARFDPENRYSVPYFWGTAAVGIRTDHVTEPVKGFEVLFDPRYKGLGSLCLTTLRDVVAIVLLYLGLPMNSTEEADLAKVKELLKKQRPLIQAYTSDGYKEKLISGEAWVSLGWTGDILQARSKEAKVRAIIPESGSMIWVDSIAIPKAAENPRLAHEFINFLLDPDIAARNANSVEYATPNMAAMEKIDSKLRTDPAVYPSPEVLARCQWLQDRGPAITRIEQLWQEVK